MTPLVDPVEAERFARDGVVLLRQRFDRAWLSLLDETIDEAMAAPGPNLVRHTIDEESPGYYEEHWSWSHRPGFERFVRESPVGELAAGLLQAPSINLVMDNWFMREAGSTSLAPFHHDVSYFDFTGPMCVCWLPLGGVSSSEGISFVRGSHLWGQHFMRVRFGDGHRPDAQGKVVVNGVEYEPPPDVTADPDAYDLVSYDLEPGDCIFFDIRTLHGGSGSAGPSEDSRRFTLRMASPEARIEYRGDWAAEERAEFEAAGYRNGDSFNGDFFPQLYPLA